MNKLAENREVVAFSMYLLYLRLDSQGHGAGNFHAFALAFRSDSLDVLWLPGSVVYCSW